MYSERILNTDSPAWRSTSCRCMFFLCLSIWGRRFAMIMSSKKWFVWRIFIWGVLSHLNKVWPGTHLLRWVFSLMFQLKRLFGKLTHALVCSKAVLDVRPLGNRSPTPVYGTQQLRPWVMDYSIASLGGADGGWCGWVTLHEIQTWRYGSLFVRSYTQSILWVVWTMCMFTTNIHLNCCPQIVQ